jgi:twinkle protein
MNAGELSSRLASRATDVCGKLLPKGKKLGREWKVADLSGEPGDSLSVCTAGAKAGKWSDFATGESGDLIDLWMACRNLSMFEAIKEIKAYLGIKDEGSESFKRTYAKPVKPPCRPPRNAVYSWLLGRGLSEQTLKDFKIGEMEQGGKTYAVFPYIREDGLVNAKYRNPKEKKDMRQEKDAEPCLFGWHLINPKARSVAICEGEIDAMTLHQAGIPALSVNAGAGNHQWIENDWDRLECFDDIVLCFDNDEAGQKGAADVVARLGVQRCRIAIFGKAKDANEYLTDHGATAEDFVAAVEAARSRDPEELRAISDYMEETKALFWPAHDAKRNPVLSFGSKSFDFWEWRPAEVTVWTGINGHGKSLMLMQTLIPIMRDGERVCVFSGELSPKRQLKRLSKQIAGLDRPTPQFLDHIGEWLQDRCWIFNTLGVASLDRLLEVFRYAASRYGVKHFVVDSLMMTDVPEDGPGSMTAQKQAMRKLCSFAQECEAHVHLVAHPRKARDESAAPGKMDVSGSGHITNGADNVMSVWSANKEEGEDPESHDATLMIVKDREGDAGSRTIFLYFDRKAQQYTTDAHRRARPYIQFSLQAAA